MLLKREREKMEETLSEFLDDKHNKNTGGPGEPIKSRREVVTRDSDAAWAV